MTILRSRAKRIRAILTTILILSTFSDAAFAEKRAFHIDARAADAALVEFGRQAGRQILFGSDQVKGVKTNAIAGSYEPMDAIRLLLQGTGLRAKEQSDGVFVIESEASGRTGRPDNSSIDRSTSASEIRVAEATEESATPAVRTSTNLDPLEEVRVSLPEVLVTGSKALNFDIRRSRDDEQPYVVFERARIEQSGAVNIDAFLKQQLTMNTVGASNAQRNSTNGSTSTINLRGLGAGQTLILIDGHRTATTNGNSGTAVQPDLNGIPLAAVERIEVLPATASGIYGGGATGGVVNVVLRRDYSGAEAKLTYGNSFDSDVATRRVDFSSGFSLEGGRTSVLFAGSYSDNNPLLMNERDFYERGIDTILANAGGNYQALNLGSSPPLGATPNIRSTDGSNLTLRSGAALNSPITFAPGGYAGTADGGAALVANAGRYNLALADTAQTSPGGRYALLSQPRTESIMATVRRDFGQNFQAFLDVGGSNVTSRFPVNYISAGSYSLPVGAATNPFNQAIQVTLPLPGAEADQIVTHRERRAVGGLIFPLPWSWKGETDYTWSRSTQGFTAPGSRLPTLASSISSGTLDVLRDTALYPIDLAAFTGPDQVNTPQDTTLQDVTLRLSGPLSFVSLPGGVPTVSLMYEHRDENFSDGYLYYITPTISFYFPEQSQTTSSIYSELMLPVTSRVELQIAGRHDEYAMHSATSTIQLGTTAAVSHSRSEQSSTNPTFGLRYQPMRDLTLRGSFGTGFLPPAFSQILPSFTPVAVSVVDPRRGNTTTVVQPGPNNLQGGNPDVRPESSRSWSAGMILTPRFAPGLRVSLDWVRVQKTDNITTLTQQQVVDNEASLPSRVTRGGNLPGDLAGWAGPITGIDRSAVNLARARAEAFDLALDYQVEAGHLGTFALSLLATRQTHLQTKVLPMDPYLEKVGVTPSNPLKLKANAGLSWMYRNWNVVWSTTYFDSYYVADPSAASSATIFAQQGSRIVRSQTYQDLAARYRFEGEPKWLSNTEAQVGLSNVFNEQPPFDAAQSGLGYYSPFGDPRLRQYYVTLKHSF